MPVGLVADQAPDRFNEQSPNVAVTMAIDAAEALGAATAMLAGTATGGDERYVWD